MVMPIKDKKLDGAGGVRVNGTMLNRRLAASSTLFSGV